MVGVAQLVRAAGCGPAGRGFKSRHSPHFFALIPEARSAYLLFLCLKVGLSSQKRRFAGFRPGSVGSSLLSPRTSLAFRGCPALRHMPALGLTSLCSVCGPAGRGFKSRHSPHFFAQISGKKITKTQVFTSRGEAALHSKAAGFSSHLHQTPEALLVKTLHFIPLVKAFHYRFTCEVAACGGRMCFFFYCASLKRRQTGMLSTNEPTKGTRAATRPFLRLFTFRYLKTH